MIEVGFPGLHAQKYVYLCLCGREVEIEREHGRACACETVYNVAHGACVLCCSYSTILLP